VATGTALRRTSIVPLLLGIIALLPAVYAAIHYPAYAEHVFGRPLSALFSDWNWRAVLH
jgi:hypothetical protein